MINFTDYLAIKFGGIITTLVTTVDNCKEAYLHSEIIFKRFCLPAN